MDRCIVRFVNCQMDQFRYDDLQMDRYTVQVGGLTDDHVGGLTDGHVGGLEGGQVSGLKDRHADGLTDGH